MSADELEAIREKVRPAHTAAPDADTRIERPALPGTRLSATAQQALRLEEAARARGFARALIFLSLGALAFLPFQPGVSWLRDMMGVVLVAVVVVSAVVWQRTRKAASYRIRHFRALGTTCVITCAILLYYCGVFSAAPVVVTLGVAFFGQGDDRRWAVVVCGVAIATYFVISLAITVGILPELGLFRGMTMSQPTRFFAVVMVPAVLMVTLWQARLSRQATRDAVERLDEALRMVQQREALLQEARADLDQALGVGAGKRGPWSGRRMGVYQVDDLIGRGASGEIYAATHTESGEVAAVKILAPDAIGEEGMFERFRREADIARRLHVPNVVRVLDLGQAPAGTPFIAMELLYGQDLGKILRKRGQLRLEEVVDLVRQVAAGLEAAHAVGVVHRDLKPQNLFFTDGVWKILDFGVAKLRGSDGTLTQGAVVGTPGYMSPEQARGQEADPSSDLFSLGAVAYRALTGQPPFTGADLPESLFQIVYGMPAQPSTLVAHLPGDVDAVLAITLAKEAQHRFARASELAQAIAAAATGNLDAALRARAAKEIANLPWSTTATPR